MNIYCPNCMSPIHNTDETCLQCGKRPKDYQPDNHLLRPGTILKGKYVIGKTLGEGGFGITYLGLDTVLNRRVAIKEYFPSNYVYREATITANITCYGGEKRTVFEKGRGQFLDEARVMARLDNIHEIVHVLEYFPDNNTAYIIMEYLTGQTVNQILLQQGRIPSVQLFEMMEPVLRAIHVMHSVGIMHRDISPDNIMRLDSGQMKLLDFGCARNLDNEYTMTVMLKHGYAPLEQYTGYDQGPWTDVYALCATLYHCLTGRIPPRSLERTGKEETLIPPRKLGANATKREEQAIIKGLAIEAKNRWQTISELYAAIYGTVIDAPPQRIPSGRDMPPIIPYEEIKSKEHIAVGETICTTTEPPLNNTYAVEKPKEAHKRLRIVIAVAVILTGVITLISLFNRRPIVSEVHSNSTNAAVTMMETPTAPSMSPAITSSAPTPIATAVPTTIAQPTAATIHEMDASDGLEILLYSRRILVGTKQVLRAKNDSTIIMGISEGLRFSSSDPSVVDIVDGAIVGNAEGEAELSVYYEGKNASTKITVLSVDKTTDIEIQPDYQSIMVKPLNSQVVNLTLKGEIPKRIGMSTYSSDLCSIGWGELSNNTVPITISAMSGDFDIIVMLFSSDNPDIIIASTKLHVVVQ